METKCCSKCKQEKPASLEYFPPNKRVKSGLSPWCRECKRADGKRHYQENADVIRAQHRDYQQNHPEVFRASAARYRERHPDRLKVAKKKWADENHEYVLQKYHEYDKRRTPEQKARGRQKHKLWVVENKERFRVSQHKSRARRRSLPATLTSEQWEFALNYFNGCCAVCERPSGLWHKIVMDHWIPVANPECPGTVVANMIPLCHGIDGCNNSKANYPAEEWLIKKFGKRKSKTIISKIEHYFAQLKGDE